MTTLSLVNIVLGAGIILSQIAILLAVVYFLFFKKSHRFIGELMGKHGILLAFIVVLVATLGSLFYSEIAGFKPCDLCWFQRIFMYPEVILLGLALVKKESRIVDYALSLSVVGFLFSLYHNYIYYQGGGFCQIFGSAVSCTNRYVLSFGYITLPLMALTGFLLVIVLLMFSKLRNNA